MSPAPVSQSVSTRHRRQRPHSCRALIAAISASDLHSVSYPPSHHIHISCFPHLQAHQAFKLPLARCPLHRWYSALVNRKAEVAGSISCAGCWWQLAYCLLRLGPGPVSWEAELQLDTGQKKSVLTTPHFVLQRRSGHASVDCQIFCEICYFQDSHTHRGLCYFHSTVVKGFTIQCIFVRYWNGRNMRGARARMEMERWTRYSAPPWSLLQVWRQVSGFPHPRVMYLHYLYIIQPVAAGGRRYHNSFYTMLYTAANY